jgi:hypothetical protein
MISFLKRIARLTINSVRRHRTESTIIKILASHKLTRPDNFDFSAFMVQVKHFLESMQTDDTGIHYRYSNSSTKPTLYASAYACMTRSLLSDLQSYSAEDKRVWATYFDSFQSPDDGLFYDPAVMNDLFKDTDWWGARHLALHMISAYTDLGMRPKYPFSFLGKYYQEGFIKTWLDAFDWQGVSLGTGDVDNKIMNIGCLLQYQRDCWNDQKAAVAINVLKDYLRDKINPDTGMWGVFSTNNAHQRSRMVQFAYHLLAIFFYDKDFNFNHEKFVELVLNTQNKIGGYGVALNSSACEDIDSIDILIRFYPYVNEGTKTEINKSLNRAFNCVLLNQVADNGFVFRLAEPFEYGSAQTSSTMNAGAMFPTWFRTLSIAYITEHLTIKNNFIITTCPGYEI